VIDASAAPRKIWQKGALRQFPKMGSDLGVRAEALNA
jgi:hypothetical protein